jgi:hypothetical protein
MPLITRQGKGSKLTIQEMDDNLTGLNEAKFQGENFIELVQTELDQIDPLVLNPEDFYVGAGKLEGFPNFSIFNFLSTIDGENPDDFKSPIFNQGQEVTIFHGTKIVLSQNKPRHFLLNGVFISSSEGISSSGSISVIDALNVEEYPAYGESYISNFYSYEYLYSFDDDNLSHYHFVKIDISPIYGAGFVFPAGPAIITIQLPDDATTWEEVIITYSSLEFLG